ncbi:MAG: IS630 transposase-related protein [Alphaproteobacteria bacterium]
MDREALKRDVEQVSDRLFYERAKRLGANKSGIEWALRRCAKKKASSIPRRIPSNGLCFAKNLRRFENLDAPSSI